MNGGSLYCKDDVRDETSLTRTRKGLLRELEFLFTM